MLQAKLLAETHARSLDILHKCVTPHGFRASALVAGYPQIWARDSIITFLGAAVTGDKIFLDAGRASLATLGAHQSARGLIPLNVNPDTGYVSTENAGAIDATGCSVGGRGQEEGQGEQCEGASRGLRTKRDGALPQGGEDHRAQTRKRRARGGAEEAR